MQLHPVEPAVLVLPTGQSVQVVEPGRLNLPAGQTVCVPTPGQDTRRYEE